MSENRLDLKAKVKATKNLSTEENYVFRVFSVGSPVYRRLERLWGGFRRLPQSPGEEN
jgi:hypothetical protein